MLTEHGTYLAEARKRNKFYSEEKIIRQRSNQANQGEDSMIA